MAENKISNIIEDQLPFFVRGDHPNFAAFIKAYYEWMDQANNAIEVSKSLLDYQDIDKTYDKYFEYFHREIMPSIPRTILADKKKLAKSIKDLYRARGSEQSYRLLFRLLYNEEIDFYYPGEDMLRLSDGRWVVENALRVGEPQASGISDVKSTFEGTDIKGLSSEATARVDYIVSTVSGGAQVFELYLLDIVGTFQDGESVALVNDESTFVTIVSSEGPVQSVIVQKGGAFHRADDLVNFTATTGSGANGAVTATTDTSAIEFIITNGGSGYAANAVFTLTGGSGFEAEGTVASLSSTETIAVNQNTILPMANVVLNTGSTFVSLGANTASVSANLASANVSSALNSALTFANGTYGTINSISMTNHGYGYSTLPTITVTQPEIIDMNLPDGSGGTKGQNAVVVANNVPGAIVSVNVSQFGVNYNKNEEITINNTTRGGTQAGKGAPQVSGVITYPGKYIDTKGFISWNNKLQDNHYYQEFSYEIGSDRFTNTYRDLVDNIVHPAGTKMFGRYRFYSNLDTTLPSVDSSDPTRLQIESVLQINVPTVVGDSEQAYIDTAANTFIIPQPTVEATTTLPTAQTHFDILKTGRGTISISSNNIIGAYASVQINVHAATTIGSLGNPKSLQGNNTFFTSDIPMGNTKIMIVGVGGTSNGVYFINSTSSNTAATITQSYANTSLTNGTFYYNTNQNNTYNITVVNSGSSYYALTGVDRLANVSGNNKTVTMNVGDTVNFAVTASGHPFYIKTTAGTGSGNQVTTPAATNQGTQSGTVSWTPNTAGTYFYQCANHGSMAGQIVVRAQGTA